MKDNDSLTEKIIGCCYRVHSELGPGFNERIYHNALEIALKQEGLRYQTEKSFTISYQGENVGRLRLDLIIEDKVIVEVKALTGNIPDVFKYQILSYLRASNLKVGLLVNFGNKSCGVKRFVL
ncbi:MAG: GxxExxY protein [Candidatus Omnitrophica bacterium]|nr:GxxExxY protein [Candidatus Omnitrophota bacterium]